MPTNTCQDCRLAYKYAHDLWLIMTLSWIQYSWGSMSITTQQTRLSPSLSQTRPNIKVSYPAMFGEWVAHSGSSQNTKLKVMLLQSLPQGLYKVEYWAFINIFRSYNHDYRLSVVLLLQPIVDLYRYQPQGSQICEPIVPLVRLPLCPKTTPKHCISILELTVQFRYTGRKLRQNSSFTGQVMYD